MGAVLTHGKEQWGERYRGRCTCGYSILCELWDTKGVGVVVLFDNEETSKSYGKRVERCPRCGIKLGLPELLSKIRS